MKLNTLKSKLKTPSSAMIFGALLLNILTKLFYLLALIHINPSGIYFHDSYEYIQLADNLINHSTFSREATFPLYPEHIRVPGYPLFLAIFNNNLITICFLQIMSNTLSLYLLLKLFTKLNSSVKGLIVLAVIFIINPGNFIFTSSILTENLSLFILIAALYVSFISTNKYSYHLIGILLGILLLIKPIFVFLPVLTSIWTYLKKGLKKSVIIIITPAILYGAWSFRNYYHFKTLFYSNVYVQNLAFYRAAEIDAVKGGISLELVQDLVREKTYNNCKSNFNYIYEHDTPIYYNQLKKDALQKIKDNFGLYLKLSVQNFSKLVFNPYNTYINRQWNIKKQTPSKVYVGYFQKFTNLIKSYKPYELFLLLISIIFSIIYVAGSLMAIYNFRFTIKSYSQVYFLLLIASITILSVGPEGDARLRYPIEILSLIFFVLQIFRKQNNEIEEKLN